MQKEKKKLDREKLLAQGRRALEAEGFGQVSHPLSLEAKAILGERFGKDPAVDLALVERLEDPSNPESGQDLKSLEDRTGDKKVFKEIKAALYRLKQKGIRVAEPDGHTFEPILKDSIEAYLGPLDGKGSRVALIFKPLPGMGTLMLFAFFNDVEGIERLSSLVLRKKELDQVMGEQKKNLKMISADWRRVDALLCASFEKTKQEMREGMESYPEVRKLLTSSSPSPPWSPLRELPLGESHVPDEATTLLLEEHDLQDWEIPDEPLSEFKGRLETLEDSPIILNRFRQEERTREVIREAAFALLAGPLRETYRQRLEELVEYFHKNGRGPQAERALRAAARLRDWNHGEPIPAFFENLVLRSLVQKREAEKEKKREEVSLIIRP